MTNRPYDWQESSLGDWDEWETELRQLSEPPDYDWLAVAMVVAIAVVVVIAVWVALR